MKWMICIDAVISLVIDYALMIVTKSRAKHELEPKEDDLDV